jgi:hypothetical protein
MWPFCPPLSALVIEGGKLVKAAREQEEELGRKITQAACGKPKNGGA